MRSQLIGRKSKIYTNKIIPLFFVFVVIRLIYVLVIQADLFNLSYAAAAGLFSIVLCIFSSRKYRLQLVEQEYIYLFMCIAYLTIIYLITLNTYYKEATMTDIKSLIFLFVVVGFYIYLENFCDLKRKKTLLLIYFIGFAVSLFTTLYVEVTGGGDLIRNTAKGGQSDLYSFAYGGYDFIYSTLIIFVIMLTLLKEKHSKIDPTGKIVLLGLLALSFVVIVLANYTTAFVLCLLSVIYCLMPNDFRRYVVILLIVVFFAVYAEKLIDVVNNLPYVSELTKARVNNVLLDISGQETTEKFLTGEGQRFDRIMWTWEIIKRYPLFGVYVRNGGVGRMGGHTQWLDDMGKYGAFYSVFFIMFWIVMFKKLLASPFIKNTGDSILKNAYMMFLVLGFLDPIGIPMMSGVLLVCAPFIEFVFCNKQYLYACMDINEAPIRMSRLNRMRRNQRGELYR